MTQFNERLRDLVENSGMMQSEFAKLMNVNVSTQRNYEKGLRKPDIEYLSRLHEAGFDAHYILTGVKLEGDPEGFVTIPHLAAVGSMGAGADGGLPHDETIDHVTVAVAWLREHLPAVSAFKNLHLITGHGDSMSGTYEDGDALFVDSGVTEFQADGIYIFEVDKEIFIKRLQKLPKGRIKALSDNTLYEPFIINPADDGFRVIGKIVGSWKFNKY